VNVNQQTMLGFYYFQIVPKDALEKMLWAETDKLGYGVPVLLNK